MRTRYGCGCQFILAGMVLAVVLIILAALSGCSSAPAPIQSKGTVVVDYTIGGAFFGGTGDDLANGAQVVILNPQGAVVASAPLNLQHGVTEPGMSAASGDMEDTLTWSVQVPGGLSSYGVRITSHGTQWYSASGIKNPTLSLDETTDGS